MGMNVGNKSKVSFKSEITKKQQLFNRFKRRYKVASTAGERQFLKAEAARIVKELKQCQKQWKACGFGGVAWICKNFTVTNFTAGAKPMTRKSNVRRTGVKSASRKSRTRKSTRRTASKTTSRRPKARKTRKSTRRSYVAW